ncbi:MAG: hypothetical protein NZ651_07085, partial [Candidatus Bipolaricaulota bacterium]|nr:hypothetical protein [Candidatus Bipolaricaulota bacterium]MDW8127517.1 hypothetical protein [Candidatus Bipolaricaulota bacterium]
MSSQTIAPHLGLVKSTVTDRPVSLRHLPKSCCIVWDLLQRSSSPLTTLRALAYAARLSLAQVHRALRRLE